MAGNGDSTNNGSGLVFRTTKLYKNESFSDVEFHVKDQSGFKIFKAHKLILAMASESFASLFYGKDAKITSTIKISDFTPQIFQLTMRYLYTDKFNLSNISEAIDVFKLSSKLGIKELAEKCRNYIGMDKITEENLFFMYDIALKENMRDLLFRCRDLVCTNTKSVFSSKQFREAPIEILEDILRQDSLAVDKEIDLINAVLLWCKCDCDRKGRPLEPIYIRDSMSPLLPFIRFLTLSCEEFCDFVEENRIFTSPETALLIRKILDTNGECKVPSGFCSISRVRGAVSDRVFRTDAVRPSPTKFSENLSDPRMGLKSVVRQPSYDESPQVTRPSQLITTHSNTNHSPFVVPTYSIPQNGVKDENQTLQQKTSMPLYQYSGASAKKPMFKVVPSMPVIRQKIYDFNLIETPKAMSSVSKRDLICSAEIQVSRGSMVIHGVHLKVLNLPHDPNESITVCLSISGNFPEQNSISTEKLSKDMINLQFTEPLKLVCNNSAKIQITIEDLKLHRCFVCQTLICELNAGLNLNAKVTLKSNQTNDTEGFFFLISRLLYS